MRQLFRLSAKFESNPSRYIRFNSPLKGKILINAFYEPSTRTRLSFDSAWHRLGGDSINITDPSTTGLAKGESLSDIAEMFNHYGDCVVLRDTSETAIYEMATSLKIPIINAGNGIGEHPTQAMADLFTILKWRPTLCRSDVEPGTAHPDRNHRGAITHAHRALAAADPRPSSRRSLRRWWSFTTPKRSLIGDDVRCRPARSARADAGLKLRCSQPAQ